MAEKTSDNMAQVRLSQLFDDGSFTSLDATSDCGASIGFGSVMGATVFAYAEGNNKGVFDAACAAKLSKVYDLAEKTGSPVVTILDSCGVALEGGVATLEACSQLVSRVSRLSGVVPQVAVVAGTCGGFSALCASMADVTVMSEDAQLFLTAPFVDASNKNGSAQFALSSGAVSKVCSEDDLFDTARTVVGMLPLNNLDVSPVWDVVEPEFCAEDAVSCVADAKSAVELFGTDDMAVRTFLGTVGGKTAGLCKVQGRLSAKDSARLARMASLCDAYSLPMVTFVDSEGFVLCSGNDVNCGIKNAALMASVVSSSTNPKVTVVTGKAIGSVYSVLCGKGAGNDMVYAWPTAVISALSPEAAVTVLWDEKIEKASDVKTLAAEYAATQASAENALLNGSVDRVIAPETTRAAVLEALDMLQGKRVASLPKKHANLPY